jgi:hypothetical protein
MLPAFPQETNLIRPNEFSSFKIINDRNIFDPNRRPHVVAGPPSQIVDSFSLTGTIVYGRGPFAVFDGTGPDYHKVLERGGVIAGYTVTNIGPNSVKLASGTNQVDLKVGMQMRRNEDGLWSPSEQSESALTFAASGSSRRRDSRRSSGNTSHSSDSTPAPAGGSDMAEAPPPGEGTDLEATNLPPEGINGDANDPVARMMRRRAQELNGNDNRTPNP